jgi:hypothetical protein
VSRRLRLAAADAGPDGGLPAIVEALAGALRAGGHAVDVDARASDDRPAADAVLLDDGARRAAWLLGRDVPRGDALVGCDLVAAATADLRARLRRARAIASDALVTIPVGPLGRIDPPTGEPFRVALLGLELQPLAEPLVRADPRLHVDVLGPERSEALLGRLPAYGFLVAGPAAVGVGDVGLLTARAAGAIVLAARAPGRHELIFPDYDGFLSDEPGVTPAFVEACVRHIASLAGDPGRARLFRERARRGTVSWAEIAGLWARALDTGRASARVTVVMSAYDVESFVEDAVDSVLGQTYRDLDLVVVDDGSTDRTTAILREIHDPRLLVLEQANGGVWAALNAGLAHAHRELVARMDADDLTHPRRLALQVDFLDRHPRVGLLGTGFYRVDVEGHIRSLVHYPLDDRAVKRLLTRENAFLHPTVMFRRRILERTGPYRRHEAEDYDLWLRVSERATVANLEPPLHRLRRTGQTRVARFEREIIASAEELRRQALGRCLGQPDASGHPAWRRPRWLGLPVLQRDEVPAYAETLHAWAESLAASQPRLAARLYTRAIAARPLDARAWLALARSVAADPSLLARPLAWLGRRLAPPGLRR